MAGHPQAAKLKLTSNLPRSPGVYLFCGHRDEVLYVGKATNLRQRVRSYFGREDRRRIGPMLREAQSVRHHRLPDPLSAEVVEARLIARLQAALQPGRHARRPLLLRPPRRRLGVAAPGDRQGRRRAPGCTSVRCRRGRWPTLVVEALQAALPLRRCSIRLGRSHVTGAGRHAVRRRPAGRRRLPVRRRWPTAAATTTPSAPPPTPSRAGRTPSSSG